MCLYSILTHATGFLLKLLMKWERFRLSKVFQAIDALFMFFHVYLVLICVQSFAEFQIFSGQQGGKLDPEEFDLADDWETDFDE